MAEEILNCTQQISLITIIIINIIIIIGIIKVENLLRDREETYKTYKTYKIYKIFFILTFVEILVSITEVVLELVLKKPTIICLNMLFAVFYGWLCLDDYKILKELKNDIKKRNEEENENLTNIKEKDTK